MNRLSVATFSLATAVAVMTLGYANPSFADKPNPNHNHGGDENGDGAAFTVDIGDLAIGDPLQGGSAVAVDGDGKVINPWLQSFGGKKSIGLNNTSGRDVGTLTGVGALTGESTVLKAACFPAVFTFEHDHDMSKKLHQAIIKSGKKGRAEASFWFHGATTDGMVRVLYLLKLFGDFVDDDGFPVDVEFPGEATLLMTTWELNVENEGKTIKEMSCRGEGTDHVTIEVTPL